MRCFARHVLKEARFLMGAISLPCCRHPRQTHPMPFLNTKLGIAGFAGLVASYLHFAVFWGTSCFFIGLTLLFNFYSSMRLLMSAATRCVYLSA